MKVSLVFLIILFRASLILSQNPPFVKSGSRQGSALVCEFFKPLACVN